LIKPSNSKPLKIAIAALAVVAVLCEALYEFSTCDQWIGQLAHGTGMGMNQTCECHGWNIVLFNEIPSDGSERFLCLGVPYTTSGQPIPDSDTDTE
jgi:hypothetical protein